MTEVQNPYVSQSIRQQLFFEARAMAEYALANGLKVPVSVIHTIESYETRPQGQVDLQVSEEQNIEPLARTHETLSRLVEPAKPSTILLLDHEQKSTSPFKFLGPVALIRQMMVAAILSLTLFISLGLSDSVNGQEEILSSSGLPLLLNLLFFIAAAGLGASFAALYKANSFITQGTFDPTYHSSYWIRFLLGMISGLLLAVMISKEAFNSDSLAKLLEPGILHPLLAMLGGFSADLFYTILSRLVGALESLFSTSAKALSEAKLQEEKSRMASQQIQQQGKLAVQLMQLQQQLAVQGDTTQTDAAFKRILADLLPNDTGMELEGEARDTPAQQVKAKVT